MPNYFIDIVNKQGKRAFTNPKENITHDAIRWFLCRYGMESDQENSDKKIQVSLTEYKDIKCWGECVEGKLYDYEIKLATDQCLRDYLATVMHEMVHVRQWERYRWTGDGEKEAEELQYKLADDFWTCGIIW